MPMMETGRGAEPGLLAAAVAAFALVSSWRTAATPCGEKVWPRPLRFRSVTCQRAASDAGTAPARPTDRVAG